MSGNLLGGRYRRERVIGRGAMGEVWLGRDELLDRPVAIKTISAGGITGGSTAHRDELLARMMREARLAARLNHRNIVAVHDLVLVDGEPNVVMEYVDGHTLDDEIRTRGSLPHERVAEIGAAVADALADAHELGIVHRDIKPANILITRRGVPKLADFGIAKLAGDAGVTTTGTVIGTTAFLAPEVARGRPADPASDMWSLGATLYAALDGHAPFQLRPEDDALVVLGRLMSQPVPPLRRIGPVAGLVSGLLSPDPAARPGAATAARALRDAGSLSGPPRPSPGGTTPVTAGSATAAAPRPVGDASWSTPTQTGGVPGLAAPTSPQTQQAAPSRRQVGVVVAVALVLVAALAVGGVLLLRGSGGGRAAAAPSRSTTTSASAEGSAAGSAPASNDGSLAFGGDTASPPSTEPVTTPNLPASTAAGGATVLSRYTAPGGMNVEAPAGWTRNDFFGVATTAEYVDGPDHFADAYLHIGVGNTSPNPSWATEVAQSRAFLPKNPKYHDVVVDPAVPITYRGTDDAADISFAETNAHGVRRQAIERLWEEDGVVYVIQLSAPAAQWSQYAPVFTQMTQSCVIP